MVHESITVDDEGIRIAYRVFGDPTARPMLLIHALGETGASWDEIVPAFSGSWRVYVPDLRGHGHSDWPETYSLELLRDDMIGFCDRLDLTAVTVVGHSLGGIVSYLLAQRRPDLVARLVLEDSPMLSPALPKRALPDRPEGPLGFDWALASAIYQQRNSPDPAWTAQLTEIRSPTLAIAGGPTSHIPHDIMVQLARRMPHCQLATIPAGHNVHEVQPAEFITAVERFLASAP